MLYLLVNNAHPYPNDDRMVGRYSSVLVFVGSNPAAGVDVRSRLELAIRSRQVSLALVS